MNNMLKLPLWDFFKGVHKVLFVDYEFDNDSYWTAVIMFIFCIAVALFIIWLVYHWIYEYVDEKNKFKIWRSGIVIDKKYTGEQHHSGTGTAVMPNTSGGVGIGVTSVSSHTPEKFLFFIKDLSIHKVEVTMEDYYKYEIGSSVHFETWYGGLSKDILNSELIP